MRKLEDVDPDADFLPLEKFHFNSLLCSSLAKA